MIIIYALCQPNTLEIRYVGKTKDLESRLRAHKWEAVSSKVNTYKVNWLRSLNGFDPEVKILEEVEEDKWIEAERRWIDKLREEGCRLTNYADGGQTSPVEGKGHSEFTKELLRQGAYDRNVIPPSRFGSVTSEETKAKLRETHLRIGTRPPPMGGWNKGIKRTHCRQGHEYTSENTQVHYRSNGLTYNTCKTCVRHRYKVLKGA